MNRFFLMFIILLCSLILVNPCWAVIEFNETNDHYLTCGTDSSILFTGDFSVSAWIKPDDYGQGTFGRIFDSGDGSNDAGFTFFISSSFEGKTNSLFLGVYNVSSDFFGADNNSITLNQWQHVGAAWDDGNTDAILYVNGIQAGTGNDVNQSILSTGPALIGIRDDMLREFDGEIDELCIWNAELTAEEMALLGKSKTKRICLQVRPGSLRADWSLDDFADGVGSAGNVWKDLSGNGNDCTQVGASPTARPEQVLTYP